MCPGNVPRAVWRWQQPASVSTLGHLQNPAPQGSVTLLLSILIGVSVPFCIISLARAFGSSTNMFPKHTMAFPAGHSDTRRGSAQTHCLPPPQHRAPGARHRHRAGLGARPHPRAPGPCAAPAGPRGFGCVSRPGPRSAGGTEEASPGRTGPYRAVPGLTGPGTEPGGLRAGACRPRRPGVTRPGVPRPRVPRPGTPRPGAVTESPRLAPGSAGPASDPALTSPPLTLSLSSASKRLLNTSPEALK